MSSGQRPAVGSMARAFDAEERRSSLVYPPVSLFWGNRINNLDGVINRKFLIWKGFIVKIQKTKELPAVGLRLTSQKNEKASSRKAAQEQPRQRRCGNPKGWDVAGMSLGISKSAGLPGTSGEDARQKPIGGDILSLVLR